MAGEIITVQAGGQTYSDWTSVEITAGAAQAARSFSLETTEPDGLGLVLKPGTSVEIYAGGDLVLSGRVDDHDVSFDASSHRVSLAGRSHAADWIDGAADHPTGELRDVDVREIAAALDRAGVGSIATAKLKKIPVHRVDTGETVFESVERAARGQGLLLVGIADGSVEIARGARGRHAGALEEGRSILSASGKMTLKGRASEVKVRGQGATGSGGRALRIEAIARDREVPVPRPKIIVLEGDADPARARERALWQVRRAAGASRTAEIVVAGWRDMSGRLWEPAFLIPVASPLLHLDQDMAIKSVSFRQSNDEGTRAVLSLVDPRALGGEDSGGESDAVWSVPEDDVEVSTT